MTIFLYKPVVFHFHDYFSGECSVAGASLNAHSISFFPTPPPPDSPRCLVATPRKVDLSRVKAIGTGHSRHFPQVRDVLLRHFGRRFGTQIAGPSRVEGTLKELT